MALDPVADAGPGQTDPDLIHRDRDDPDRPGPPDPAGDRTADMPTGRPVSIGAETMPPVRSRAGAPRPQPLFLARSRYRHRRLRDVARLMPVLAMLVWLFPLLWRTTGAAGAGTGPGASGTASAAVFLFGGWAVLIVVTWALSRRIDLSDQSGPEPSDPSA